MGEIVGVPVSFTVEESQDVRQGGKERFRELLERKVMDVIFQNYHAVQCMPESVVLVKPLELTEPSNKLYGDFLFEVIYRAGSECFRHTLHFVYSDRGRKLDGKLYTQQRHRFSHAA
jgi:hypothetical protein